MYIYIYIYIYIDTHTLLKFAKLLNLQNIVKILIGTSITTSVNL